MVKSLILVSFLAAVDAVPEVIRVDEPARVIVEFRTAAASRSATLARFRRDLESIVAPVTTSAANAPAAKRIRREYTVTFFGAAVEISGKHADAVRKLPYVRGVYLDRSVQALSSKSVSETLLSDARTRVNSMNLPTQGEGITVAVIDTGIDYRHPALGGAFGAGNKVAGGYDFYNDDPDPLDDNGHGTHVAGIIAADSEALIGVAPKVTLLAFKVLGSGGSGSFSDVIAGIEAAADPNGDGDPSDHVDVANLSLGGLGSADDPQARAVDGAVAAGVVVCVAAGNSGGFAIIGSPGTSRSAITVGATDDLGAMTSFSSRGPTPGDLIFKPDVVAPGNKITSSFAGGGTKTLSGTSMATPHVAGVCALLVSVHPDWSPADVKRALASGAIPLGATPVDCGAGRVDAQRANDATLIASESGLSFGIDAASGGTFEGTRSVTLTNRGTTPVTLTVTPSKTLDKGVTVTATPATATIAPGQSQSFDVQVRADNATVGSPASKIVNGTIVFAGGAGPLNVPWVLVRCARVTIEYHVMGGLSFGFMPESSGPTYVYPYSDDKAEAFVTPGKVWDFLVSGRDATEDPAAPSHMRLIETTSHTISGDDRISLAEADAPHEISLAAMDDAGNRLSRLPREAGHKFHYVTMNLQWDGKPRGEFLFLVSSMDSFFVSTMPNIRIAVFETYMDIDGRRFFAVRHDELRDIAGPVVLQKEAASYMRSRWSWTPRASEKKLSVCTYILQRTQVVADRYVWSCQSSAVSGPMRIDSYLTPETSSDRLFRGLAFSTEAVDVTYVRADSESTFVSSDANPAPATFRIANGAEATIGLGPVFPLSFLDAIRQSGRGGFGGAFGELRDLPGTYWTMTDGAGVSVASGMLPGPPLPRESICETCRIEAATDLLTVAGHRSRGHVDLRLVYFDPTPPTLTALRLLDAQGRIVDRVNAGDAATLAFWAADFIRNGTDLPVRDATKVAYRIEGTSDWQPLAPVLESSESGSDETWGRRSAGDSYRVDLSPATAIGNVLVDLRIELQDARGNRMTWTQSPSLMVGAVAVPPRRRAVK